jgi:hypothetical protein
VALVLQRLATKEAIEALVLALSSGSASVRKAAARSLSRVTRRRQGAPVDVRRIEAAIQAELGGARLALAALRRLEVPALVPGRRPRTSAELLGLALLEERDHRVLQALLLLEVLLPHVRLDVVSENLRSESAAARGNAIELLDNGLPEPWKNLVLAALDEVKRRADLVPADALERRASARSGGPRALRHVASRRGARSPRRAHDRSERGRSAYRSRAAQGTEGDGMITTVEKVLFLKSIDLFRALPGEELAQIAEIAEEQPFAGGEQVFGEGEPGDALYLVVDGLVKVHQGGKQLAQLGPRDVFGEMAVLDSEPRSATVTAVKDAVLLRIARDDFRDILQERPEIGMGVIQVLSRRLRHVESAGRLR